MGQVITYTMAANHIATAVSELPEVLAKSGRNISGVNQTGGEGSGQSSIHNADGSINTGHISDWKSLSFQERKEVIAERKRLGVKYRKKGGAGAGGRGGGQSGSNRLKQLKEQNSKYKRQIKALKREDNGDEGDEDSIDAGDQFGGKQSKKKTKKETSSS